jgi:hypothetical protein
MQLTVASTGVRVLRHRRSRPDPGPVETLETAIARFVDEELGPSCQGISIRVE